MTIIFFSGKIYKTTSRSFFVKNKFISKVVAGFAFFVLCITALVGCTPVKLGIETNANVTGNGGLAVQKGDYLYFVNGYTSASDMKDGDNKGGNSYSAIYRAKLDNGDLQYDEDGNLKNAERIVDKVVGFDKTKLYIFGDYIYYATPNTDKKDNDGTLATAYDLTDFCVARLDGKDQKMIYKTNVASDDTQYAFYAVEQKNLASQKLVFLAVYDSSKLVIINCSTKEQLFEAKNVSSVVMPQMRDYNAQNNAVSVQESTIYYARSSADDDNITSGNVLCSIKLGERQENVIAKGVNTYAVSDFASDALLFTQKRASSSDTAFHYVAKFDKEGNLLFQQAKQVDNMPTSNVLLCPYENGNYKGYIFQNDEKGITYCDANGDFRVLADGKELTILDLENSKIYCHDSDNSLYAIDYTTGNLTTLYQSNATKQNVDGKDETWPEIYFDAKTNFSIAGNYAYFYVKYTGTESGYYLNRVKVFDSESDAELVGVLQKEHIKTNEEDAK